MFHAFCKKSKLAAGHGCSDLLLIEAKTLQLKLVLKGWAHLVMAYFPYFYVS